MTGEAWRTCGLASTDVVSKPRASSRRAGPARSGASLLAFRLVQSASPMSVARASGVGDAVLIVRPSSLGDIVYALAVASDIRAHRPHLAIDWIAERGFVPLIEMCPDIRRAVPFALRSWRRSPFSLRTWRDVVAFRRDLRADRYRAILDLQEQIKGALIARAARGHRHGFDRRSVREPITTLAHDVHHRVPRDLHFVDRCRKLAAAALGYSLDRPPHWHIV